MKRYIKVVCPLCGKVTYVRDPGESRAGCDHFERVREGEGIVVFNDELGGSIPVDLKEAADRCLSFSCPICNADLDACLHGDAEQYKVKGRCPHFSDMEAGEENFIAHFYDEEMVQHTVEIPR